jgi:hypothetical protein
MLNCKHVNKRFYQDAVSTKTRSISETTLFDRHYSFDQSKDTISLSIVMTEWENMLKDK